MIGARVPAWQGFSVASGDGEPSSPRVRLRRTPRRRSSLRGVALAGGVGLVALMGLASLVPPPRPAVEPAPVADLPTWLDIDRPNQLFALAGSPYARLSMDYTARRRRTGTGREDRLTFGDPGTTGPSLRLVVSRRELAAVPPADLVVDYARLAATAGEALTRAGLPFTLATRFGGFDTAELTLQSGERKRACLGFRLQDTAGPIGMIGVACGDPEHAPDRGALACTLDRIDLLAAGDDKAMRLFFTGTAQHRGAGCEGGPTAVKRASTASGTARAARGT